MPTAKTNNQRSRALWSRTPKSAAPTSHPSSATVASLSRPVSSSSSAAMPAAVAAATSSSSSLFPRPQPRRTNSAPAAATTALDADDLAKRLSMVLAQERQRKADMDRKRQSWEADLMAARREQARRPPRPRQPQDQQQQQQRQPVVAVNTTPAQQQQPRPTVLTAADFQDQPLPSLDEDFPLEIVPPRPPVPFILNSSGYVPVYAVQSSIKLNGMTTLRRSSGADHGRSLRRDAALDLETIDENHGSSAAEDKNNNTKTNHYYNKEPTVQSWQLEDPPKKWERSSAGLVVVARPTNKHRHATYPNQEDDGHGRARLRRMPTGPAKRPSQLGNPLPEWSQAEDTAAAVQTPEDKSSPTAPPTLSLTLVRRGSERAPQYTWSPAVADATDSSKPSRRRSIRETVESYCTVRPRQYSNSPSTCTASSSDSGRDDVHSSYSSRSWRSSLRKSLSASRRSSVLKFWDSIDRRSPTQEKVAAAGGLDVGTDSDDSSDMTPQQRKRSSLLSVFHL